MVQPSAESIKFLGVTIDKHLSLKSHISQLSRTCMRQLKEIRRLRQRLDRGTTETLIRSFITSRIDYCNAILFGLPATTLLPLKRILHTAARIIAVQRRYDHITLTMMALHWLPIRQRIAYKTACLVYRCLNGTAPTYLANQLTICDSHRLYNQRLLVVPFRQTNGFESSGPNIWNSLPQALRTADQTLSVFKVRLKTFLFQQAYIRAARG